MTHVKICGITLLEDALFAVQAGVWALGFNFYKKSPRYVTPEKAMGIISVLTPQTPLLQAQEGSERSSVPLPRAGEGKILKIGIFIDESPSDILNTMAALSLDYAQVYDDLPFSKADKNRMILALRARDVDDLPSESVLSDYAFILLDAPKTSDGVMGGTGRLASWDLARKLAKNYPLILAGGINPSNVQEAIQVVKPFAVDAASGVEKTPGIKDRALVSAMYTAVLRSASPCTSLTTASFERSLLKRSKFCE